MYGTILDMQPTNPVYAALRKKILSEELVRVKWQLETMAQEAKKSGKPDIPKYVILQRQEVGLELLLANENLQLPVQQSEAINAGAY